MNNLEKYLVKKKLAHALMKKEANPLFRLIPKGAKLIKRLFKPNPAVVRGTLKNRKITQAGAKLLTQPVGKKAMTNPSGMLSAVKTMKQGTPGHATAFSKALSKRQKGDVLNLARQNRIKVPTFKR